MHLRSLLSVLCLLASALCLPAADRSAQWQSVADAQKARQPQTASAALETIITSAIADNAYPEALRAILIKAQTDASTENYRDQAAAQIRTLTGRLAAMPQPSVPGAQTRDAADAGNAEFPLGENAKKNLGAPDAPDGAAAPTVNREPKTVNPALPEAMRPLLEAALAKQWWAYYQQNRWQLLQRTQTAESPSDDFLTWDARRVLAETARHFEAALANPAELQRTPIATLEPLLAPGALPDAYRPTLYDFLIHEAIAFHSAGEQGVSAPEDAFTPTADSPILGTLEEFLAWQPATPGNAESPLGPTEKRESRIVNPNPALRATQLYQQLLRFHLDDPHPRLALADADLARLNWAASFLGEPARDRHLAALRAFIKTHSCSTPAVSTAASLKLAELLEANDPADAVAAAQAALQNDRNSINKNAEIALRNLIARIKAPSLQSIATETTWPTDPDATASTINIRYRNQPQIHFRAYPLDWKETADSSSHSPNIKSLRTQPPAKSWSASIPATPDYRFRDEKLPAPRDLAPGFYLIAASLDEDFSDTENIISSTTVWVGNLAIVNSGADSKTGRITGYVLNAITGDPVPAATVTAYSTTNNTPIERSATTTNHDGFFTLTPEPASNTYRSYILHAIDATGQSITTTNIYSFYRPDPTDTDRTRLHIYFFTDRSLYRPGQPIQFKAVVMRANPTRAEYELATNHRLTIAIDDPNNKEAARLELTTNDFGAVSGSFTVPPGRLNGAYALHTIGAENGRAYISIEEYKRPKFEVTLPAPATAPKLNETATLAGAATAYTGAPIDGAKVTWRVQRDIRWPRWCWWLPVGSPQVIAHGATTTDATGNFTIAFTARPDLTADPASEPTFNYTITAEVTDTTGETRAATRTINIGYTALSADIKVDGDWQTAQTPVTLKLETTTLDGEPQSAAGTVAIHALKQPAKVPQPELENSRYYYYRTPTDKRPAPDINSPDARDWPIEEKPVVTLPFATDAKTGLAEIAQQLPAGIYRAIVTTKDRFGKPVTAQTDIRVLVPDAPTHPIKEPLSLAAPAWTAQPGDTINALWGTGYNTARARISIEQDGKVLRAFWTNPGLAQQSIPIEITESMRGGITLNIIQVRDNRLSTQTRRIDIPWDNKKLKVTWERFTSKLTPGGRETWTARITAPNATTPAAEFAAALYDASLDQFHPHTWPSQIAPFRTEKPSFAFITWTFSNNSSFFHNVGKWVGPEVHPISRAPLYRHWRVDGYFSNYDDDVVELSRFAIGGYYSDSPIAGAQLRTAAQTMPALAQKGMTDVEIWAAEDSIALEMAPSPMSVPGNIEVTAPPTPDLTTITARKNLNETAFFYPNLLTDPDGSVRIEFTAPEALTRWKFLGFAHDKQLRSALLTDTAVTSKDLMVQPNPPRFLREGDTVEFTVKITNTTDKPQTGAAQLTFADATTLNPVNLTAGGTTAVSSPSSPMSSASSSKDGTAAVPPENPRAFTLAPNTSQTLSWRITIPDGQGFLTYKAVASTGAVSDGEEGFLPVLSRCQLVTESIALSIRDAGTRTFRFDKLAASASDATLRNESLTVQMTSNPAWYAVLALPSLMEFPHECSEQLFNRYYANALAAHIANSDPKIARVFEQWRNTPALDSPLLKNEDLKSVLIEETPWLRAATRESEQRRALARLFDANRTAAQTDAILRTLAERQRADGLWAWFPGGSGNEYITRYIVAGFARLRHFGIKLDDRANVMLKRAILALDSKFTDRHANLKKQENFKSSGNHITTSDAFQLYTRSFFLKEIPIPGTARDAFDYFKTQAARFWQTLPRQSQAHAALAIARMGEAGGTGGTATPAAIVTSLKQRAKTSDELGMWWADADRGWFWWQAPIETHALMIELFDEVARDEQAVSVLQLWLLKQKQTQAWPSTKATADAVYALLLRGAGKLASDALVSVTLGGAPDETARATQPESGTGFYSRRIAGNQVTSAMGEKIIVTKTDAGPAWGSVTWQYFQTLDKIIPHEGTPLTLRKTIWKQINTASGPTLIALDKTTLAPGDTLIVRIELRTNRDMEFIHMKDQRGSGTEPVNVLSGYRWKNGLGYYESTRDAATHFFMDRLPAGTHVFEYPIRVQLRGRYESGIAEIQCMYAPEYNSHSASTTLTVD